MSDAPSAWKIEKALAVWREAMDDFATDEGAYEDLALATSDVRDVLHRLVQAAVNYGDLAVAAAQREAAIKQRKDRFLAREEKTRTLIAELMQVLEVPKAEWGDVTVAVRPSTRTKLIITDPDAIPNDYVDLELVRKPKTKEIKTALEFGQVIDGTALSNSPPTLVIRTT